MNSTPAPPTCIQTPYVIYLLKTIKAIQNRAKDPDLADAQFAVVYDTLSREFNDFFEQHGRMFAKILRGEGSSTIAAIMFYKDQICRGLMTEAELSDKLATHFIPENLKKEADEKIKEMQASGEI